MVRRFSAGMRRYFSGRFFCLPQIFGPSSTFAGVSVYFGSKGGLNPNYIALVYECVTLSYIFFIDYFFGIYN